MSTETYTNSTASNASAPVKTAAELLASMKAALDSIPRGPFAELMDREGMPPEDGYILILPARFRDPRVPRYVRFADVPAAYIVKDITGAAR